MERNQKITTKRLVITALLAALTAVSSAIRITMPLTIAGTTSFHLGNVLCALSGILLGPWLGGLAAGLGSAIYDMFNPLYISEAWMTFLMKGVYGLAAGAVMTLGGDRWNRGKTIVAAAAGALSYAVLYLAKSYFYGGIFLSGLTAQAAWVVVLDKLPATIFNGAIAVIFAPVLSAAIQEALKENRLSLN